MLIFFSFLLQILHVLIICYKTSIAEYFRIASKGKLKTYFFFISSLNNLGLRPF